jgi:hypothetical protein
MVHLLGKHALRHAYRVKNEKIDPKDIEQTLKSIAENETDPILEGRYKKAIASSLQREAVLKALANKHKADGEILTSEAYKLAFDRGVENPSQYVGQLVTDDYGAEIVKVRDRIYRFRDSLFLAYVKARPRYFNQTDSDTDSGNAFEPNDS